MHKTVTELKISTIKRSIFFLYFVCKKPSKLLCSHVTRIGISVILNNIVQFALVFILKLIQKKIVLPIGVFRSTQVQQINSKKNKIKNRKYPRIYGLHFPTAGITVLMSDTRNGYIVKLLPNVP